MLTNSLNFDECMQNLRSSILKEANKSNVTEINTALKEKAIILMRKKNFVKKVISQKQTKVIMNLISDATQRLEKEGKENNQTCDTVLQSSNPSSALRRLGEIQEQVVKNGSKRMYTPLSRMNCRPSSSKNKPRSKIKLVKKRLQEKRSNVDETLFQSYEKSNPEFKPNSQLRYCSFSKDSVKNGITSTSISEFRSKSPALYSGTNNMNKKNIIVLCEKQVERKLDSQNTFNTLQNKETATMINKDVDNCLITDKIKNIDHFEDYLKQADCQINYDIRSENLPESTREMISATDRSKDDFAINQKMITNKNKIIYSHGDNIFRKVIKERSRPQTVFRQSRKKICQNTFIMTKSINKQQRRHAKELKMAYIGNNKRATMSLLKSDKQLSNLIKVFKLNKTKIKRNKRSKLHIG